MPPDALAEGHLDFAKAEAELDEYKDWLDRHAEFSETDIVRQLKARKDLCLLIHLAAGKGRPDRFRHEFALLGAVRADLVIGSSAARHFVLIEFEGGTRSSIFNQRRGSAQLRDWGNQIQLGFSQVTDWTWVKNDGQHSALYKNAFGLDHFSETYLVVCGRTGFLNRTEDARLHWRSEKTMIASCSIRFWTYDDLYVQASAALDVWRSLRATGLARPPGL
jgi:Domain of unknown function (DUF4263)